MHFATFHLGLHRLLKSVPFKESLVYKGLKRLCYVSIDDRLKINKQ